MAMRLSHRASLLIWVVGCGLAGVWAATQSGPVAPMGTGTVTIDAVPVPLNPQNPSQAVLGDFSYAGGIALTSRQSNRLHGISDLEVTGGDRLIAVTDFGDVLEARLMLDRDSRLLGLVDAHLAPLAAEDGQPMTNKQYADAEGLALLSTGDRLVSFEVFDRIWRYPGSGGAPRSAPGPDVTFPSNLGMEALAADPDAGPDAYVVGAERSGETWTCRLSSSTCNRGPRVDKPQEFGLVAVRRLPGAHTAYLLRAFDAARGIRVALEIARAGTIVTRLNLSAPLTTDNFEGLAAVPRTDGGIRFYLVSDDNASPGQRTLLVAFDWRPR